MEVKAAQESEESKEGYSEEERRRYQESGESRFKKDEPE